MKRAVDPLEVHAWYGSPWDPQGPPDPPKVPPDSRHTGVTHLRELASKDANVLKRVGLVLGRFHPPHLGHLHLVERAFAQCGWLHIVTPYLMKAGSKEHGDLFQFAFAGYGDQHHVRAPEQRSFDPASWAQPLSEMNLDPKPTHLFSSDRGAQALADAMHIEHVLIDPDRKMFPISSSMIRADLKNHIHWLAPGARHRLAFTVGVVGAEGSGKSTLCRELGAAFDADVVEDPVLDAARAQGGVPGAGALLAALDEGANRTYQAMRHTRTGLVVTEASRIVGVMWAERLGLEMASYTFANAKIESKSLWLLCHNDFPYAGERDEPEKRRAFFEKLRSTLVERDQPFVDIVGEGQERVEIAVREIRTRFDEHMRRRQQAVREA